MKVYMDRKYCTCWQASCEAVFGWKLINQDFAPGGCVVSTEEDGQQDITVYIKDNEDDKVLIITEDNWAEAYDSWLLLFQKQQVNSIAGQPI